MRRGDHIKACRGIYSHHGIYMGNDRVIHYSGELGSKRDARICRASLAKFAKGSDVEVVEYASAHAPEVVCRRAESRLGEVRYGLIGNNCEHFARWCKTGDHRSEQVHDAAGGVAGVGAGTAATAGGIGLVSATGAVAGLSGPGIMSGLATVGSAVGAGAVGGLAALGAAPALAATAAMRQILRDDPALPATERDARTAGRTATAVGGVAGTAGTIATVSAMGSVTGLSGAGIASGLAAMGAGSMVAGTVVALAAPAAAAVAVGYAAYRLWKWMGE